MRQRLSLGGTATTITVAKLLPLLVRDLNEKMDDIGVCNRSDNSGLGGELAGLARSYVEWCRSGRHLSDEVVGK